jgi:hypothetical protein
LTAAAETPFRSSMGASNHAPWNSRLGLSCCRVDAAEYATRILPLWLAGGPATGRTSALLLRRKRLRMHPPRRGDISIRYQLFSVDLGKRFQRPSLTLRAFAECAVGGHRQSALDWVPSYCPHSPRWNLRCEWALCELNRDMRGGDYGPRHPTLAIGSAYPGNHPTRPDLALTVLTRGSTMVSAPPSGQRGFGAAGAEPRC